MSKFFVSPENVQGDNIVIYGEDVNHISKVLRLEVNHVIMVCDGSGKDYKVVIKDISKEKVISEILESVDCITEPPINITLYQGIPKSSKMEYIVQKTTELGISNIVSVTTKRTIVNMEKGKAQSKKILRWQRIAHEAAKQSNRGKIPKVSDVLDFSTAIKQMKTMDMKIMPYELEQSNNLKRLIKNTRHNDMKNIGVIIGPEGGFTPEEVQECIENDISVVSLGPRILRTETAGITVAAILMYELGDI